MTQIYTILFDLDGTIVNTAPDLMAAHNHVMKKFGHAEKKLSDIKKYAKFVKITKAGFYESMVHNVDEVKNESKYNLMWNLTNY